MPQSPSMPTMTTTNHHRELFFESTSLHTLTYLPTAHMRTEAWMGGHCWSKGRHAYFVQHIDYIQTPPPSSAPFFRQSRGRGEERGRLYKYTHITRTRGCKEGVGKGVAAGGLRYETVDCKVVRALQSNASIINAIHLTTPSAPVPFNSFAAKSPSHHVARSTQPSTSWSTHCSCRPSRRPQGRRPAASASGSTRTRSCSPRAAS